MDRISSEETLSTVKDVMIMLPETTKEYSFYTKVLIVTPKESELSSYGVCSINYNPKTYTTVQQLGNWSLWSEQDLYSAPEWIKYCTQYGYNKETKEFVNLR